MRYELFLRSTEPLTEAQLDAVAKKLEGTSGAVDVEAYTEGGQPLGVDLVVDVEDPRATTALCESAFSLAEELQLTVYDPQLSRPVTAGEEEEIRQQLEQVSTFSEAALVAPAAGEPSAMPSTVWIWLVLIGAALLLYVVSQLMTCGLANSFKLT